MNKVRSLVLVSCDPISMERGAGDVYQKFQNEIISLGLENDIAVSTICDAGRHDTLPVVIIYPEGVVYGPVAAENVHRLVDEHLSNGKVATELLAPSRDLFGRLAWLNARKGALPAEQRIVLRRIGQIDPNNIEEYIAHDGYQALRKVLTEMKPDDVITEIKKSGLRGRGGAGFPTGMKWTFVYNENSEKKFVICNADESEPGTFKDRLVLEGDPHSIVEAMAITAFAVGADEGYIYIRGEYKLAQERFQRAIDKSKEMGYIGKNILGTNFNFELHVHSGAGAYVCGEETALIESIEGSRGQPRSRPPFPTTNGLWGKPTVVNNVETLANVPPIMLNGASWYRSFGTQNSPGTKVYTILGNVNKPGWIEVQMGITLREVIGIYAKGMKNGVTFKLAQTGGSSGSIIPASLQDTPMDFDSFSKAGVSLGSGALLICNEDTCVVDLAKVIMNFFRNESCGKCNPCRIGTQRAYEILEKISEGGGSLPDLDFLMEMCDNLYAMSHCGLGQTAGTPIRDILTYFRAEVEAHIRLKVCPTGVCKIKESVI